MSAALWVVYFAVDMQPGHRAPADVGRLAVPEIPAALPAGDWAGPWVTLHWTMQQGYCIPLAVDLLQATHTTKTRNIVLGKCIGLSNELTKESSPA